MFKKKTPTDVDETIQAEAETKTEDVETLHAEDVAHDNTTETIEALDEPIAELAPLDPPTMGQTGSPTPRLESYIRQHDDTPRALATVRLEGGGAGDGTYLVDAPVPRSIGHRAERYVISRTEPGVTVYLWVNR